MLFCYCSRTVATSQSIPEAAAPTDSDYHHDVPGTTLTDCCEDSSPEDPSGSSVDEAQSLSNSIDPDLQSGDFGCIVKLKSSRQLTPDEKYYLLKHHFVLDKTYIFLIHSVRDLNRKFQRKWLDEHNGLIYSVSDDGG